MVLKNNRIGQSAAKPRIGEGSTTIENTQNAEVNRVGVILRSAGILNEKFWTKHEKFHNIIFIFY